MINSYNILNYSRVYFRLKSGKLTKLRNIIRRRRLFADTLRPRGKGPTQGIAWHFIMGGGDLKMNSFLTYYLPQSLSSYYLQGIFELFGSLAKYKGGRVPPPTPNLRLWGLPTIIVNTECSSAGQQDYFDLCIDRSLQ